MGLGCFIRELHKPHTKVPRLVPKPLDLALLIFTKEERCMPVVRKHHNKNYTVMSNYHFKDKTLSLKAKGLLSLMLSLPEDWDYSASGLATLSSDGLTAVRTALQELEEHRYLYRQKVYTDGKVSDVAYHLFEHPQDYETFVNGKLNDENLILENITLGTLIQENQAQLNTNNINTTKKIETTNKIHARQNKLFESTPSNTKAKDIVDMYKELCTNLPTVRVITDDRIKKVNKIVNKYGTDTIKEVFLIANESEFLQGNTGGTWKGATFDWIFNEKNFVKILEGNYTDNREKKTRNTPNERGVNSKHFSDTERSQHKRDIEELRKAGYQIEY